MKPRIFISSVSSELATVRQLAANSLLRLGYEPVWQDIFGTESGDLRQKLREQIDDCRGLIQLVGQGYGAEPPEVDATFGRVSYTQFEFLYAHSRNKKTWLIFTGEACTRDRALDELDRPRDPGHPDSNGYQAERRALQEAWQQRWNEGFHLNHTAVNDIDLELKIERLKDEFSELRREFREWQQDVTHNQRELADTVRQFGFDSKRAFQLLILAIVLIVSLGASHVWNAIELKRFMAETHNVIADLSGELKKDPAAGYEAPLVKVSHAHKEEPQQIARDIATYRRLSAATSGIDAADKERALFLGEFADINAVLAQPKWEDARWKDESGAISAARAKFMLEAREKKRNSFGAGLGGPLQFAFGILKHGFAPEELSRPTKTVLEEMEEIKQLEFPKPEAASTPTGDQSAAPIIPIISQPPILGQSPTDHASAATEPPIRSPINLEDYVRKPGSPPEANAEDTSRLAPAHWSTALERAWDETWGVGPGNYRVGFVFGCILFLVIIRESILKRWKYRMANKTAN